jgi:hypothetical protein
MNEHIGGENGVGYGSPNFTDVFEDPLLHQNYYYDSPLSAGGVQQAKDLHDAIQNSLLDPSVGESIKKLDLVVVSPLTRALQTFDIALYPHLRTTTPTTPNGDDEDEDTAMVPILAVPQVSERIYLVSDLGKTRRELKQKYPYVDFETAFISEEEDDDDDDFWHYVPTDVEIEKYIEWRPHGQ